MKTILFYGDSNTYGYDPRGFFTDRYPKEDRWVWLLRQALKDEWIICDDGMNGRCIPDSGYEVNDMVNSIRSAQQYCREKMDQESAEADGSALPPLDYLAIMLGSNDAMEMNSPDTRLVSMTLADLVNRLRENGNADGFRQLMIMAPPDMDFSGDPWFERIGLTKVSFSDYYRQVAEETGSLFVDVAAWNLKMGYDRVHLSEEGHHMMAERMEEVLRGL